MKPELSTDRSTRTTEGWRSALMPPADARVHPAAAVFPPLSEGEYAELRDDIRRNGVCVPIVVDVKGRILDGRHRLRAAHELSKPCPAVVYDGTDPIEFVTSMNIHRRHLTESQRAMIAEQLANLGEGRPSTKTGSREPVSTAAAAKLMRVSPASVKRAKVVRLFGDPALVQAVENGKVSVNRAAALAKPKTMMAASKTAEPSITCWTPSRRDEVIALVARIAKLIEAAPVQLFGGAESGSDDLMGNLVRIESWAHRAQNILKVPWTPAGTDE